MPVLAPWGESTRPPDSAHLQIHPVPDSGMAEADEGISRSESIISEVVHKVMEARFSYQFSQPAQYSDAREAARSKPEPPIQERPPCWTEPTS